MTVLSPIIGIDLGTTNSCVAVWDEGNGTVSVLANREGFRVTPSVVAFKDQDRLIGQPALNQAAMNTKNTVYDIKRLIGRNYGDPVVQNDARRWPFEVVSKDGTLTGKPVVRVTIDGKQKLLTAEEISAMVLAKLKETAKDRLGKPVSRAVITVPAYFNSVQRQATVDAGTIAGLERAKCMLSSAVKTTIEVDCLLQGHDFSVNMTRARFEDMCDDLVSGTLVFVEEALDHAHLNKAEIDEILMVGGSTRIPYVQQVVSEFFEGKPVNLTINPDEAVAFGAAVKAVLLDESTGSGSDGDSGQQRRNIPNIIIQDVAPLSLGLELKGSVMRHLIKRGTPIPAKVSDIFTTSTDYQTEVMCKIFEGERPLTEFNHFLDKFKLDGIPPALWGVTFELNANAILQVKAVDLETKKQASITIAKANGQLTQTEIKRMLNEAAAYREEDKRMRARLAAWSELEAYVYRARSAATRALMLRKISPSTGEALQNTVRAAIKWIDVNTRLEVAEYNAKRAELSAVFAQHLHMF
ncbi:Heat shock 70 kDa protein 1A [Blastocladiella emersonii ATCC 22665]|nr:Heat shock 70 kDa protein 1A [Blastocladiella emersonii ATCC 22665]